MTFATRRLNRAACRASGLALSLLIALCACSRPDGNRILGHWHSESMMLGSLNLPIAPDILIQPGNLVAVASGARVPIESVSARDSEVILTFAAGLGLSFFFESDDRMFVDVPFFGKVYYERVAETPAVVTAAAIGSGPRLEGTEPPPVVGSNALGKWIQPTVSQLFNAADGKAAAGLWTQPQELLQQARAVDPDMASIDYRLAVNAMKFSDADAAVRHLADSLAKGFTSIGRIEAEPAFKPLRQDVRYIALMARYR